MGTFFTCENELRRAMVRDARDSNNKPFLNGIDFVEVSADQTKLTINFIHPLPGQVGGFPEAPAPKLGTGNFLVEGGVRVTGIRVLSISTAGAVATLTVSSPGDFANYVLKLVGSAGDTAPPSGFDSQLAEVEFNFKIDCPSDFDCAPEPDPPPPAPPEPELDYLVKDYASFRRLMLDRLATVLPDWQERNPADTGVVVVEALAYAADQLSYYQDAVASEAYLNTARRRVSLRRHSRLLDYPMHEGVNARVWVQVNVNQDGVDLPAHTTLFTRQAGLPFLIKPGNASLSSPDYDRLVAGGQAAFETLHAARLYIDHEKMDFYTWGNSECCLPAGATRATLKGAFPNLKAGDVLILEETRGPQTGLEAQADPSHRQAVRLVRSALSSDPLGGQFENPAKTTATPVTEIEWRMEDALTFPLWVSSRQGTHVFAALSAARGNIVLADHGRTVRGQPIEIPLAGTPASARQQLYRRLLLTRQRLIFSSKYHHSQAIQRPAVLALIQDPRQALPSVTLQSGPETWSARRDLLNSDRFATEFVVEIESGSENPAGGEARLRFGDNIHGRRPAPGARFTPEYRVGGGASGSSPLDGNIGANSLFHIVSQDTRLVSVRNPLPASGGSAPEPLESVRMYAPQAFQVQERAVTEEDYAAMTGRHPGVQKAVATLRWTGSWQTVFITVDRRGGLPIDQDFEDELRQFLDSYRMAAHDIEIDPPRFIPLEIKLRVCVKSGYVRGEVKQALLEIFSNRSFTDGEKGFFHPDQFSFGQTLYLSPIISAAMQAPGVEWVEVLIFKRWGKPAENELQEGKIEFGRLEIARLDNDPSAPENGLIELIMEGGI